MRKDAEPATAQQRFVHVGEGNLEKMRYIVQLTQQERAHLKRIVHAAERDSKQTTRARILLLADTGMTNSAIAATLCIGEATCRRIRRKFVEGDVEAALNDRPRPLRRRKLDQTQEAVLVLLATNNQPVQEVYWTTQLLADRLIELGIVDSISDETVRRILKRNGIRLR